MTQNIIQAERFSNETLAEFLKLVNDAKTRIKQTTPDMLKMKMDKGQKFYLVDIREDDEWEKGHIVKAIHFGKGTIERDIEVSVPDRKAKIVLYCGGGYRSSLSADNLQKMGYKNVTSMLEDGNGGENSIIRLKNEMIFTSNNF